MLIKALIKDTVPPIKFSDTIKKALNWMEEFHVNHLPVVDDKGYAGLLPVQMKIEITVKGNKTELSRIIAGFERYNYNVKEFYHQNEYVDTLKSRYDSLMNYLNI